MALQFRPEHVKLQVRGELLLAIFLARRALFETITITLGEQIMHISSPFVWT